MAVLTFHEPRTVAEACALMAADPENSRLVSGGTAAVLMIRQRLIDPAHLVSLRDIPALHGITWHGDTLRIGAAVTLREIAGSPEVRERAPSLAYGCGQVGNPRIRNVATIGGNLAEADYASDPPSVLASLGATCRVVGPASERDVPVAGLATGFYQTVLGPDEIITRVDVPCPAAGRRAVYLKYRTRSSEDRACVGVAARVDWADSDPDPGAGATDRVVGELDVVVAAVAATPQRVPDVLRAEAGNRLNQALADRVAAAYAERIDPIDDARGSSGYRRQMVGVFVHRALAAVRELSSPDGGGTR